MPATVHPLVPPSRSLADRPDDDLMLLTASGSTAAFETLVRRHAGRVLAFTRRFVGDPHVGEELAQEIWIAVWDHRDGYRPEGKFVVWLFTIARNRARNAHRARAKSPPPVEIDDAIGDPSPSELDRLVAKERRVRVDRAMQNIPEQSREAILLRFGQELPYDALARALETNESTARSRVFHGLRELRRRLTRGAIPDGGKGES